MTHLVPIDEPRGLFALVNDEGQTLAVGYLVPDGQPEALVPGSTTTLRFHVVQGGNS